MLQIKSQQIRTVLKWQALGATLVALIAGFLGGLHMGVSVLLGGLVSIIPGLAYGILVSKVGIGSADNALLGAMRAEAIKIFLIVMLLWLVLALYKQVHAAAFIGCFILSTLVFSLAIFFSPNRSTGSK